MVRRGRYETTEADQAAVARYVEIEVEDMGYVAQKVRHVELVKRERLFGDMYEVWDVHTNKGRWWVVTPLMNLYSQRRHKSVDEVLSFHVGLSFRMLDEAAEGLRTAEEVVEYQAVGVALREALLALVKEEVSPGVVTAGSTPPAAGNFLAWANLLVAYMLPESSRQELRAHLRESARTAWIAVGWLVHAADAGYWDAELVYKAVEEVLSKFSLAAVRKKRREPERCPECGSNRRAVEFANGADESEGFVDVCLRCDWKGKPFGPDGWTQRDGQPAEGGPTSAPA